MSFRVKEAYSFYRDFILANFRARKPFYEDRKIHRLNGAVPAQDWEVFGAILVNDFGNDEPYGSDLTSHEIKSTKRRKSGTKFEYQYHKKAWREKLAHDRTIDHVFILYESGYEDLEVYVLKPQPFAEHVESQDWFGKLRARYGGDTDNNRGRCDVHLTQVQSRGSVVMQVRGGQLASLPMQQSPQSRPQSRPQKLSLF